MAFLNITEYASLSVGPAGLSGQVPAAPALAFQNLVNTGGNVQSAALNAQTRIVRLHADSICAYNVGIAPTAIAAGATGTSRLAANQTEYIGVPVGQGYQIAVILST